jgi:hypothetical protein
LVHRFAELTATLVLGSQPEGSENVGIPRRQRLL